MHSRNVRYAPTRGIRVDDGLWNELVETSQVLDETISATYRRALKIGLRELRTASGVVGPERAIATAGGL